MNLHSDAHRGPDPHYRARRLTPLTAEEHAEIGPSLNRIRNGIVCELAVVVFKKGRGPGAVQWRKAKRQIERLRNTLDNIPEPGRPVPAESILRGHRHPAHR